MKRCPKCGYTEFYVTAHVTQDWRVDQYGNFLDHINSCTEVTHSPDDFDIWSCAKCGYDDDGKAFNVKEEK